MNGWSEAFALNPVCEATVWARRYGAGIEIEGRSYPLTGPWWAQYAAVQSVAMRDGRRPWLALDGPYGALRVEIAPERWERWLALTLAAIRYAEGK